MFGVFPGSVDRMVRRYLAVLGGITAVVGIVGFAINEHAFWAWIAIGGLIALVVGAAWVAHREHEARIAADAADGSASALERLISSGHVIAELPHGAQWDEWLLWTEEADSWLRARFDVRKAREFHSAAHAPTSEERPEAIERQVTYLEGLREPR